MSAEVAINLFGAEFYVWLMQSSCAKTNPIRKGLGFLSTSNNRLRNEMWRFESARTYRFAQYARNAARARSFRSVRQRRDCLSISKESVKVRELFPDDLLMVRKPALKMIVQQLLHP